MAQIYGQLQNAQLENLSVDPTTATAGRFYLNTATGNVVVDDGTTKRALLRNDGKAIFGTDAAAANNVRVHHAGVGMLQFVPGNDTTAENSVSTTLAQVGFRATNLATAPATGNVGRIYFNTATSGLQIDNGTTWLQFSTLTGTETLTNKTLSAPKVDVLTVTDQTVTPATPASGTLVYTKNGSLFKLSNDGLESQVNNTNGAYFGYNYLPNGDFESGIAPIQYASTAITGGLPSGTGPTIGSTPNSWTLSVETTNPLRRSKSLRAQTGSTITAGSGFPLGPVVTLQPADRLKTVSLSLVYSATVTAGAALNTSGTAGSQNLLIAIYDLTAGAWVNPTGGLTFNTVANTQYVNASFTSSNVNGQQYQLFLFNAVTTTSTVTLLVDDVFIGVKPVTPSASDPVTLTVALNAAYSTAVNAPIKYDTKIEDSAGQYSIATGLYTFPTNGRYTITFTGNVSATGGGLSTYLLLQGAGAGIVIYFSALNVGFSGSLSIKATAGQTLGIAGNQTATYNGINATLGYANTMSITRTGN